MLLNTECSLLTACYDCHAESDHISDNLNVLMTGSSFRRIHYSDE